MQALEYPPLYCEARAYCDEHDITDLEAFEKARLHLCHRAYTEEMQPWLDKLAGLQLQFLEPFGIKPSPAFVEAERAVNEICIQTAQRYGLAFSPLPVRR